jgi:transposase
MTPDEKRLYAQSFPLHVGVDTGKSFHVLVARGPDGSRSKPIKALVSRQGFDAALVELQALYPGVEPARTLVGLEFAGHHGFTFAHHLAQQGFQCVNILPANTKRSKEVEDNSPLKTDDKDAGVICDLLRRGIFVRFPFLKRPYTELRLLTAHRYRLTVEATRYKNRLQGMLDLAWPELLQHFCGLHKRTPRLILDRWPLPCDLLAASPRTVMAFVKRASRGQLDRDRVKALIEATRTTIGLPDAPEERRLEIRNILARWALLREQLADLDDRIAAVVEECPEAKVLLTVPSVGAVCAATLVADLGTPEDFEHWRQVVKLAGMNIVTSSSGHRPQTITPKWQSKRGRPMLRRQLFLLAGRWCQADGLYREHYLALRSRNGNLGTHAVCSIARKMVPMLLAVMQRRQPFDLERWQANRHQREAA